MQRLVTVATLAALIGVTSGKDTESYTNYEKEISECYKDVTDDVNGQAAAQIRKALIEEIDWQISKNWKIKLPEDQKDAIKTQMIEQSEDFLLKINEVHQNSETWQKNDAFASTVTKKYTSTLDAEKGCSEIQKNTKIPYTWRQEYMAKEAIRVAFREAYGKLYKVGILERIGDILPFKKGKDEIKEKVTHHTHIYNTNDPENGLKIGHKYDAFGRVIGSNVEGAENFGRLEIPTIDFTSNNWLETISAQPMDFGNTVVNHSYMQLAAKPGHKHHKKKNLAILLI